MKIFFASGNTDKLREVREILSEHEIFAMDPQIVEDGQTFAQNALKKATVVMQKTSCITLADDSGLEINFLNGAPGIFSARFLQNASYTEKCNEILKMMNGARDRIARFVSAIALVFPDSRKFIEHGYLNGFIADKICGDGGFGYDPIFYVPEYKMTIGEMSAPLKNKISHRRRALNLIKKYL